MPSRDDKADEQGLPGDVSAQDTPVEHTVIDRGILERLSSHGAPNSEAASGSDQLAAGSSEGEGLGTQDDDEPTDSSREPMAGVADAEPASALSPPAEAPILEPSSEAPEGPQAPTAESQGADGEVWVTSPSDAIAPAEDPAELGDAFPSDSPPGESTRTLSLAQNPEPAPPAPADDSPADHAVAEDPAASAPPAEEAGSGPHPVFQEPIDSVLSVSSAARPPAPEAKALEDAWATIDAQPAGWPSLKGESRVERWPAPSARPSSLDAQGKSSIFLHGNEVVPEESARLVFTAGADAGHEFRLGRETIVGRATSCGIVLVDPSVSREHARILREGDNYVVLDQGSNNGTYVNGKRVTRWCLTGNEEVAFGRVRAQFVAATRALPRPPPPSSTRALGTSPAYHPLLIPALISVAILASGAMVALYLLSDRTHAAESSGLRFYVAGIEAFKKRDWQQAQASFDTYLDLEPGSERGRRYLESIARERAFEQLLANAKVSLTRGDLAQAYAQAAAITDSVYTEEAKGVMASVDAEISSRVAKAKSALDLGRSEEALTLLRSVELARPLQPEVQALIERARSRTRGPLPSPAPQPSRPNARAVAEVERAAALFADGRVDQALTVAESSRHPEAQALAERLRRYTQVLEAALEQYRNKRPEPAIRLFEDAKREATRIKDQPQNKPRQDISRKLADMYYVLGIQFLLADRGAEAKNSFRAALQNDPSHAQARRKLDELER